MEVVSQIYEIQSTEEALSLIELGIDHIGSVVFPDMDQDARKSLYDAVRTVQKNSAKSSMIPLFSDYDNIMRTIDSFEPDILHFCETLTDADEYLEKKKCEKLLNLQFKIKSINKGLALMRSIPVIVGSADDYNKKLFKDKILFYCNQFSEVSDYYLTDTFFPDGDDKQPVPGFIGITGKICDWNLAKLLMKKSSVPVILAGGLGPENIFDAIMAVKPYGVDSCSNTNLLDEEGETIRFKKDIDKVSFFIDEINKAKKLL